MFLEIVSYRDGPAAITHSEHRVAGTGVAQLLDDNRTVLTSMFSHDSHIADKLL